MTLLCLSGEHCSSGSLSLRIGKEPPGWRGQGEGLPQGKGNSASGFGSRRSRQPFLSVQPAGLKGYQLRGAVSNCISWEPRPTRRAESNPFYLLPYCLRNTEIPSGKALLLQTGFCLRSRVTLEITLRLPHLGGWNGGSSEQGLRPQEGLRGGGHQQQHHPISLWQHQPR